MVLFCFYCFLFILNDMVVSTLTPNNIMIRVDDGQELDLPNAAAAAVSPLPTFSSPVTMISGGSLSSIFTVARLDSNHQRLIRDWSSLTDVARG
jgi:hypothetical protein